MVYDDGRFRVTITGGELVMDERAPLDLEWSVPVAEVLNEGRAANWIRMCLGEDELARIRDIVRRPPVARALPTVEAVDVLHAPLRGFALDLVAHLGLPTSPELLVPRAWSSPAQVTDPGEPYSDHLDAQLDVGDHHVVFSTSAAYWRAGQQARAEARVHAWSSAGGLDIVAHAEGPRAVRLAVAGADEAEVTALLRARLDPVGAVIVS